jgi:hypothetical protein
MERKRFSIILLAALALACNSAPEQIEQSTAVADEQPGEQLAMSVSTQDEVFGEESIEANGFRAHFSGLDIHIPGLIVEQDFRDEIIEYDTLYFTIARESSIYEQPILVTTDLVDVVIEESETQSIAISDDYGLCIIEKWMAPSPWRLMRHENSQNIAFSNYRRDTTLFPQIDLDELRNSVREQCVDRPDEIINQITSPFEPPCLVLPFFHSIRITGTQIYTGHKVVKVLNFSEMIGC